MKRLPILLAIGFITITVRRVAHFAGGDGLAWMFATALAITVAVSAYLMGWKKTRVPAFIAFVVFSALDGVFNMTETLTWSYNVGRWTTALPVFGQTIFVYQITDPIYGLFPTLAAGILGWLARYSEQLALDSARRRKAGFARRLLDAGISWLEGEGSQHEPASSKSEMPALPAIEQIKCSSCKRGFASVQALNAHMRFCAGKQNGKEPMLEKTVVA